MKGLAAAASALVLLLAPAVAFADDDEYEEYDEEEEEVEVVEVAKPSKRLRARREDRPSSGTAFLVTGGIFTGLGAVNLLTAPVCLTDLVDDRLEDECLVGSLVVGGVFLAVGIPLLAVGGAKRAKYNEWREQNRAALGFGVAPTDSGAKFVWRTEF